MAQIQDGTGSGTLAKVDAEFRMYTNSVSEGPLEHASALGNAAYFSSTFTTGTTDVEIMSLKNGESDKVLVLTRMLLGASVAGVWTLIEVTSGTAAGTTLTYQNPNLDSGVAHTGTFFGNAAVTGSLSGNTLILATTAANTSANVFLEGSLQLANNDEIAITFSADGTVYVTVIGLWENPV